MIDMLARSGEYGFVHQVRTGVDASADFVSCTFHYRAPDGTVSDKTCDSNDASEGKYGWVVTDGFFDTAGRWTLQISLDRGASGVRKLKRPIAFLIGASGEDVDA